MYMSNAQFRWALTAVVIIVWYVLVNIKKFNTRSLQLLSYICTYVGAIVGIGSVAPNNAISFSGPPVILIFPSGPTIGVSLLLLGFAFQISAWESEK